MRYKKEGINVKLILFLALFILVLSIVSAEVTEGSSWFGGSSSDSGSSSSSQNSGTSSGVSSGGVTSTGSVGDWLKDKWQGTKNFFSELVNLGKNKEDTYSALIATRQKAIADYNTANEERNSLAFATYNAKKTQYDFQLTTFVNQHSSAFTAAEWDKIEKGATGEEIFAMLKVTPEAPGQYSQQDIKLSDVQKAISEYQSRWDTVKYNDPTQRGQELKEFVDKNAAAFTAYQLEGIRGTGGWAIFRPLNARSTGADVLSRLKSNEADLLKQKRIGTSGSGWSGKGGWFLSLITFGEAFQDIISIIICAFILWIFHFLAFIKRLNGFKLWKFFLVNILISAIYYAAGIAFFVPFSIGYMVDYSFITEGVAQALFLIALTFLICLLGPFGNFFQFLGSKIFGIFRDWGAQDRRNRLSAAVRRGPPGQIRP